MKKAYRILAPILLILAVGLMESVDLGLHSFHYAYISLFLAFLGLGSAMMGGVFKGE